MPGQRVAEGEVYLALNDREMLDGLRRAEREFHETMRDLDREKATARIEADLKPLQRDLAKAKRELRELEGQRATATVEADQKKLDAAIKKARAEIKRLDGQVAHIEIDVDIDRLKEAERLEKQMDAARKRFEADRQRQMLQRARTMASLHRQEMTELRQAEQAAYRIDAERTRRGMEILKIQQEYAKLTDRLENIARRRPVRREDLRKQTLDANLARQQMLVLKQQLNALGAEPPVEIKVDMDRASMDRARLALGRFMGNIAGRVGGLSNMTVRLGPFTTSIRGAITALGILGPTIIDVIGSASALIGVLGAGIAGAASVGGAALTGLALSATGVGLAISPMLDQLKEARSASDAYAKAILQYGKDSDQARTAQEKLNNVLKGVDPNVRRAAEGMGRMRAEWTQLTAPTRRDFGAVFAEAIETADALMPRFAQRTNQFSSMLRDGFTSAFEYLRGEGGDALDTIQRRFNQATPAMLSGIGSFGEGLINVFRSASRYIDDFADGFANLGQRFEEWTEGGDLGPTIDRWVGSARDLVRFFGAATRVMTGFFGAGVTEGRVMVQTMTNALNRWDAWIRSTQGQESLGEFFERARLGAEALYATLAPLIAAFVEWAGNLSPLVTGFFRGAAAVAEMVNGVVKLVGMTGALGTLGATIGAMWAIGKIGAFVSMLARVATGFQRITGAAAAARAASFQATAAASVLGGGVVPVPGRNGVAVARGGAANMRGVTATPGGVIIPAGVATNAERTASSVTRMTKAASVARGAMTGLGAATLGIASPIAGIGVAAAAAGVGLYLLTTRTKDYEKAQEAAEASTRDYYSTINALPGTQANLAQSYLSLRGAARSAADAEERVQQLQKQGKTGTQEYRQALLDMRSARLAEYSVRQQAIQLNQQEIATNKRVYETATRAVEERQKQVESLANQRVTVGAMTGRGGAPITASVADAFEAVSRKAREAGMSVRDYINEFEGGDDKLLEYADAHDALERALDRQTEAQQQAALADLNRQRAMKGMIPIAQSAARAFAELDRRAGRQTSEQIATRFDMNAGSVARAANRALSQGATGRQVMKVTADTRDAELAIARLKNLDIGVKRLRIVEEGGEEAVRMVRRITGEDLKPKQVRIIERGGEDALNMLNRINDRALRRKTQQIDQNGGEGVIGLLERITGINLPNKSTTVRAVDQATSVLGSILNAINAIPAVRTITTFVRRVVTGEYDGGIPSLDMPGFARGGLTSREIMRAHEEASRRPVRDATAGLRVGRPTYITGEEGGAHPEFVIASNPAYRKNNIRYWEMAGRALGIPGFAYGGNLNRIFPGHGLGERGAQLTFRQVRALAEWAGFTPAQAIQAAQVAIGESGLHPGIIASDRGLGLMQITPWAAFPNHNTPEWRLFKKLGGARGMRNPFNNMRMARFMFQRSGGDWDPWYGTSHLTAANPNAKSLRNAPIMDRLRAMAANPGGAFRNMQPQISAAKVAVDWARSMKGKLPESAGSNRGPALDRLQQEFGMVGQAWCAMFVSEALEKADVEGFVQTALVNDLYNYGRQGVKGFKKGVHGLESAKAGDVWIDPTTRSHTGLVTKVLPGGRVRVVAGNTSSGNVSATTYSTGMTVRPNYGMTGGGRTTRGGAGSQQPVMVPGIHGFTSQEKFDRLRAQLDRFGADVDESVKTSMPYLMKQLEIIGDNRIRIQRAQGIIRRATQQLDVPMLEKGRRDRLLEQRRTALSTVQQLRAENRQLEQEFGQNYYQRGQRYGTDLTQREYFATLMNIDPTNLNYQWSIAATQAATAEEKYRGTLARKAPQAERVAALEAWNEAKEAERQAAEQLAYAPLNGALALAAISEDSADDRIAFANKLAEDQRRLAEAQRSGDWMGVQTYAAAVAEGQQAIQQIDIANWVGGPTQAQQTFIQAYMQRQQNRVFNPLNKQLVGAQMFTPDDFSDDIAAMRNLLGPWEQEFANAMNTDNMELIEWARNGLQTVRDQLESLTAMQEENSRQLAVGHLDAQLAVAGLSTFDLRDDLAAVNNLVGWWQNEYWEAVASGVSSRIQTAAQNLAQYQQQARQITKTLQVQPLEAQYALAQLTESFDDDTAAIQALLGLHEQWLAQAQAVGDFGGIIEEAGIVKQLRDQLKSIQTTRAQQIGEFNAARLNLYREMAGNNNAPGNGAKVINVGGITNNFAAPPPDEHTWSRGIGYELQVAF